jgi:putative addiction module component (TIGR02574 family)
VAERLIAPVLKTGLGKTNGGSNPSSSAQNRILYYLRRIRLIFFSIICLSIFISMASYLSEIIKLSIPERILLVEAIWDSICLETDEKNPYKLSAEQIAILEEEMTSYSKNPEEGSAWEDIKKRILKEK